MELLERSAELALLDERLAGVRRSGEGRLVLVAGEAGVGKTSLVREFGARHRDVPVLEGACEALFTPRPLGPLLDIASELGGELAALTERSAAPAEVLRALSRQLRGTRIVVLEDLHWSDEATLDLLRLLGRRVSGLSALVIATYRDDELDRLHPLRIVVGELPRVAYDRLSLEPLSPAAVYRLAAARGVDGRRLHDRTGGNPFFVSEVLAGHDGDGPPSTVRDAVLARAARLDPVARRLLEALAVVPPRAELWLLEAIAAADLPHLEACLNSGMVRVEGEAVAFRHEIARVTIESEIPLHSRVALNRAVLAALAGRTDPARLAHHAEAAGDDAAVLVHATAAGERAARLGAHREAAAQFARALRRAGGMAPADRAELLGRLSYECYLTHRLADAIDARERALVEQRAAGDRIGEGDSERWLSRLAWYGGDRERAEASGLRAVELLEPLPVGRELGMAYSNLAQLRMLHLDCAAAVEWGMRAVALAERLGDTDVLAHALINVGAAELYRGQAVGGEKLDRALALSLAAGLDDNAGRAYANLGPVYLHTRDYAAAEANIEAGLAYCLEHHLDTYRVFLGGWEARLALDRGDWDAAADLAAGVLREPDIETPCRITPLTVIGAVRARRGDGDPWEPLDEALELARRSGEPPGLARVAAARAEALWLAGGADGVAHETETALELAIAREDRWSAGELCLWRHRAGIDARSTGGLATPFRAELEGRAAEAARFWTDRGCPYEAALALAGDDGEDALRASLPELQRLGATPAAARVARRLRERGARNVARGPRAATRENPAGLTARQLEVLELLAEGARNADIAAKLFLSEKTVDHHVSAILRKLGVRTRGQAGAEAARLGIARS